MRQMFVNKVKETEAELKEKEREVIIHWCFWELSCLDDDTVLLLMLRTCSRLWLGDETVLFLDWALESNQPCDLVSTEHFGSI